MASLDLSAAFDTVNIDLLLKRMRIIGLLNDVVDLVSVWLKELNLSYNSSKIKCKKTIHLTLNENHSI